MQRILKYHLLLSQLIETTVKSHEDYSGLRRAHQAMVDLGQYLNEDKSLSQETTIDSKVYFEGIAFTWSLWTERNRRLQTT